MYTVISETDGVSALLHDTTSDPRRSLRGTVALGVNDAGSFDFTMLRSHPEYGNIQLLKTRITVKNESGDIVFKGRAARPTKYMASSGEVGERWSCEGELTYLCDTVQPYTSIRSVPLYGVLSQILYNHNEQASADEQITLGQVYTSQTRSFTLEWGYSTSFDTLRELIIENEDLGGEIRLRYENDTRYLDYTDTSFSPGSDRVIELAVDMKSVEKSVDPSEIATAVLPLGPKLSDDSEKRMTGPLVVSQTLVQEYGGRYVRAVIFEEAENQAQLAPMARQWLEEQKTILYQYTVDAVELAAVDHTVDEFRPGTRYRIKNPLIGLDETVRCISKTIDINDPSNTSLTFGDEFATLTSLTTQRFTELTATVAKRFAEQPGIIQSTVKKQTDLLRGVEGGYRLDRVSSNGQPLETIYMDSPDMTTASHALRINQNGLGFWKSSDGGSVLEGPYTAAWTIDGTFNTAFILAQVLTGLKINNGNGTFEVNEAGHVTASALEMTGGSIHLTTDSENYDVIELNCSDWTLALSPLQLTLENSTIGGRWVFQAGGIFGYWNDESKVYINSNTGDITTYTSGGNTVFHLDTNGRQMVMYDSNGNPTLVAYGNTGNVHMTGGDVTMTGGNVTVTGGNVTVTDGSHSLLYLDQTNRILTMYDSNGNRTAYIDAENGNMAAKYHGTIT